MTDSTQIKAQIKAFLESTFLFSFEGDRISDDANLFENGLIDSFGLVQLISFLEKEFNVTIPQKLMTSPELTRFSGMIALVESRLAVER